MTLLSSLQIAINNEAREEKYYLEQAKRSKNPVVQKLLTHLAKEEVAHQEWIEKRHKYMTETGQWPENIALEQTEDDLTSQLESLNYQLPETSSHDDSDIECLQKAARFEMEAADFYFQLAAQSTTPEEQAFFQYLGKLEQDHMASIRDSLAYLEDPEGYFMSKAEH